MNLYQRHIVDPLKELEKEGKGELIKLTDEVYGFQKGSNPKTLITSGHHGAELYGTY